MAAMRFEQVQRFILAKKYFGVRCTLKRNTRFIFGTEVRRTLYQALVRPRLGYATQIWAPQSIELIVKLERIQRRATKFILKLPYSSNISYTSRLETLNLIPICYWHELLDLTYFAN